MFLTTTEHLQHIFLINGPVKKIGPQCEFVWDFGHIKVDALWINERNNIVALRTGNIYTF